MTIQVSREVLNDIIEALTQCAEYLEPKMDADGDSQGFHPNTEMQLYTLCADALDALPVAFKWEWPKPAKKEPVTNQQFADALNAQLPFPMFTGAKK